jgi:hypothetical protein
MKPTKKRAGANDAFAMDQTNRLLAERARIVARLRELETQEMAGYIRPTFPDLGAMTTVIR